MGDIEEKVLCMEKYNAAADRLRILAPRKGIPVTLNVMTLTTSMCSAVAHASVPTYPDLNNLTQPNLT